MSDKFGRKPFLALSALGLGTGFFITYSTRKVRFPEKRLARGGKRLGHLVSGGTRKGSGPYPGMGMFVMTITWG